MKSLNQKQQEVLRKGVIMKEPTKEEWAKWYANVTSKEMWEREQELEEEEIENHLIYERTNK